MRIQLAPWVNTKTYYINDSFSISFIEDVKLKIIYFLRGSVSDIWYKILQTQNFDEIYSYSKKIGFSLQLNDFISELQMNHLIITDKTFQYKENKYLTLRTKKSLKNAIHIEKIQNKIAEKNNLISTLYLTLNYRCNLKCRHCCNPKDASSYNIDFTTAKKIIDEAVELGVNEICLTGGECTINKDFIEIAKYIRHKYLKLHIFTNGQRLYDDENFFNEIVNIYPSVIQISLYSMNPKVHDNITQIKGSHKKTMEIIEKLRKKDIDVRVSCFQMSLNYGDDIDVKKYAKSVGAEFLSGCIFINNNRNNNIQVKLSSEQIKEYYMRNINNKNQRRKIEDMEDYICSAGLNKLSIAPNLDINPCIYFDYVLANYNNVSLSEVKNNILPKFLDKFLVKNLEQCYKNDYCDYCSYCPTHSYLEHGNFLGKSKILCEDAIAYRNAIKVLSKKNKERT